MTIKGSRRCPRCGARVFVRSIPPDDYYVTGQLDECSGCNTQLVLIVEATSYSTGERTFDLQPAVSGGEWAMKWLKIYPPDWRPAPEDFRVKE